MHDVRRADEDAAARLQEKREILHRSLRLTQMLDDIAQDDVIELFMPLGPIERLHIKRLDNGEMARERRRLLVKFDAVRLRPKIRITHGEKRHATGTANLKYAKRRLLQIHHLQKIQPRIEGVRIFQAVLARKILIIFLIIG